MCDGCLYLLGMRELRVARLRSWSERVDALTLQGDWLEALALALDHHETAVLAAEAARAKAPRERGRSAGNAAAGAILRARKLAADTRMVQPRPAHP